MWRERFIERWDAVSALGFDDVFQRMWELYLAYSEAGFRSGYLDVFQWTFAGGRRSMNFVLVSAASVAVLVVLHGITFAIGRRIGRYNVVDVTWGLGFVGVGAVAAVLGSGDLVPPDSAVGPGGGVGAATGLAHGRQVGGQGRRPTV